MAECGSETHYLNKVKQLTHKIMVSLSAKAVNKFFFFALNYASDYIEYESFGEKKKDVLPTFFKDIKWTCNTSHIVGKWKSVEDGDGYGRMNRFMGELDSRNRKLLIEWVLNNYNGEQRLPENNEE